VLRLLADKGGVAGIYLMPFLRSEGQPTAADLIAHIEHAVNVCGEDHVGIGTDVVISPMTIDDEFRKRFAEWVNQRRSLGIAAPGESPDIYNFIPDLNTADRYTRLAALLAKRGHSETRIEKILGVNFARLFDTVWSA
jgi:membrane dipeptidase